MGYETALHLVDVNIKDDSLVAVKKALETKKGLGLGPLVYSLEVKFLLDDGLQFTLNQYIGKKKANADGGASHCHLNGDHE